MTTVNSNNNHPKGPVTILGDAYIGETLIARPNGVGDADGIDYDTVSFQWLRDGEAILGATSQKYTVTSADFGTKISVRYSYTDLGGTREVVTSDPEPSVPAAGTQIPEDSAPPNPLIVLGDAVVGEYLLARPNGIKDENGIDYSSTSFQWLRDGEAVSGATSQKYEITEADVGTEISVKYSYRDLLGTSKSLISNPEPEVPFPDSGDATPLDGSEPEPTAPDAGIPTPEDSASFNPLIVLGDAVVGEYLLARPNGIKDENGVDYSSASFQWLRDGEAISGATSQKYEITEADVGTEISVKYSYRDLLGTSKSLISNPEPEVPFPDSGDAASRAPQDDSGTENHEGSVLEGTPGSDMLTVTAGVQRIDGLDAVDTAFFAGDQTNYTLSFSPNGITVTDRSDGGLGTIALENVELLDFDTDLFGLPFNLTTFGGATGLSEQDLESIIELYIAYFNRVPDAVGLGFWGTGFANGLTLEEMAFQFVDQDETRAKYPEGTSNAEFATSVYINVLGRGPDQSGLDFWVGHLDSGALSRDAFILEFLGGARSELKPELGQAFVDQQLADRTYLDNQIDIGAYFAVHKGMTDVDNASAAMALFDGSQSSVDDAVAAIDGFYQDALDPNNGEFLMQLVGVLDDPFVG